MAPGEIVIINAVAFFVAAPLENDEAAIGPEDNWLGLIHISNNRAWEPVHSSSLSIDGSTHDTRCSASPHRHDVVAGKVRLLPGSFFQHRSILPVFMGGEKR